MPEEPLSIGEVIDLLRDEFPDVSVSKLRFLESQGLIAPARADSGYRQFDGDDLKRIRYILTQQRDHFLPLKVIKSKLTLWERGEEPGPGSEDNDDDDPLEADGEPVTRADLLRRSGLEEADLQQLVEHGLLAPAGDSTVFPPDSLAVAIECRRLLDVGLEARHLRTVRLGAEREADLLRQLTAPLLSGSPDARAQARDLLAACTDSVNALHRAILSARVRALLNE